MAPRISIVGPLILLATTAGARVVACDMVCVADERYEEMLKASKHVLVGRVEQAVPITIGGVAGHAYRLKSIRTWKGANTITLRNAETQCSSFRLHVGSAYIVFADDDPQDFDVCSAVFAAAQPGARAMITRLDRARDLPPLWLPREDLSPGAQEKR